MVLFDHFAMKSTFLIRSRYSPPCADDCARAHIRPTFATQFLLLCWIASLRNFYCTLCWIALLCYAIFSTYIPPSTHFLSVVLQAVPLEGSYCIRFVIEIEKNVHTYKPYFFFRFRRFLYPTYCKTQSKSKHTVIPFFKYLQTCDLI